jgi:hypothetical protein
MGADVIRLRRARRRRFDGRRIIARRRGGRCRRLGFFAMSAPRREKRCRRGAGEEEAKCHGPILGSEYRDNLVKNRARVYLAGRATQGLMLAAIYANF